MLNWDNNLAHLSFEAPKRCRRPPTMSGKSLQKSGAVGNDEYLLAVERYAESNSLHAGMVWDFSCYPWLSYPVHGLSQDPAMGRDEELL